MVPTSPVGPHPSPPHPGGSNSPQPGFFSDAVKVDPDNILPDTIPNQFREVLQTHDKIFNLAIVGYNGIAGPVQASVNMGPVQPPQRKGCVPQCSHAKLVELQQKFDESEQCQVFWRLEDIGVTAEYLNLSFLVKKPCGGFRLVVALTDMGRYSKPQPSLLHCSQLVDPLESSLADLQSYDHIQWDDNLRQKFNAAQDALHTQVNRPPSWPLTSFGL